MSDSKIIYTHTDEAPLLAVVLVPPVFVEAYAGDTAVSVDTRDISLGARILASLSELLPEDQRVNDDLHELGDLAKTPEANIVKLPNISASIPQLRDGIAELQERATASPTTRTPRSDGRGGACPV